MSQEVIGLDLHLNRTFLAAEMHTWGPGRPRRPGEGIAGVWVRKGVGGNTVGSGRSAHIQNLFVDQFGAQ